jgi:hypothetical protein
MVASRRSYPGTDYDCSLCAIGSSASASALFKAEKNTRQAIKIRTLGVKAVTRLLFSHSYLTPKHHTSFCSRFYIFVSLF